MKPGEYRATCTAVRNPELYRAFDRWYLKVDFCIHDDGSVVSKYVNLGAGKEPNTSLGPRSDFYKLWAAAMGRRLEKNEPMDLSKIVGMDFLVMVGDKKHGGDEGDGEVYSTVQSVRRIEPEALSSLLNVSTLNGSLAHSLSNSDTQFLSSSTAQVRSGAQVLSSSPNVDLVLPEKPSVDRLGQNQVSSQNVRVQSQPDGEAQGRPAPDYSSAPLYTGDPYATDPNERVWEA
jgi:hypothetical protein